MKKVILILVILLIIIVLWNYKVGDLVLKQIYPVKYFEYVETYSKKYNVDPLLVYSIIKAESNFNKDVKSVSNAYGLMQIMESTAREIAEELEININSASLLYEPEVNIHIGIAYYSTLLEKYNNNINLALIAYNAGFGNVNKWINEGIIKKDGSDIENVPFKETNSYVRKILRDYNIYKELYIN